MEAQSTRAIVRRPPHGFGPKSALFSERHKWLYPRQYWRDSETPTERTLSASSTSELKSIVDTLREHSDEVCEKWADETARLSFAKSADFRVPEDVRVERLRSFLDAMLQRVENPQSKEAHEILKGSIRAEHVRSLSLASMVKKQNLLRDTMYRVVEKHLPEISRTTLKMALDGMVDRSVEGTVLMLEEFTEMQTAISRSMPGAGATPESVDQAMARFCKNAMDYFDVDMVALFKFSAATKEFVCQACSAKGFTLTKDTRQLMDTFPVGSEAIEHKATFSWGTAKDGAAKKRKVLGRLTFTQGFTIPLLRGPEPMGILMLCDNSRSLSFSPEEVSIAEDLSKQVANVMQNAELFQKLSIRSSAQKVLIETAASLQKEIESEEIYRVVSTRLAELVPCDEFQFYIFDWSSRTGNPVYALGPYAAEIMADRDFPVEVGIVGYVGKTGKAEIVYDTETDPRANVIPDTPASHSSMLAVPLLGQKEVIGVIELSRYHPKQFYQEELDIAIMFANHASVALENARLIKELLRVRDEIELHMDLLTHDIANYATPINAYIETLLAMPNIDQEVSKIVSKTSRQIESIMRLVDMVRTISKLREPPPKVLPKKDLTSAINNAMASIMKGAQKEFFEFEFASGNEGMAVLADDLLEDMFVNLFYSAAFFERPQKAKVSVSVDHRRDRKVDYWWVKVSQPNKPIPNHLKGEVLRMAKTSKSELTGGFGIGLAAAKGIVQRYRGNIWVSDIVPGDYTKGCVFNITLPKAK